MINFFKSLWREEEGQDLVEYSLLLAFIALAAVGVLTSVSTEVNGLWKTVNNSLSSASKTAANTVK